MRSIIVLLIAAVLSILQAVPHSNASNVTNEQLHDGLLSLVHSYSVLEDKLDRHEQREKFLGDGIKRSLQSLKKGQHIFEPLRGTFERLDERMSEIESFLIAQDEKYKEEQAKMGKALEAIMKWIEGNKVPAESISNRKSDNMDGSDEDDESLSKKVEDLSDNVKGLRRQIGEMISDKESTSKGLLEQTEKLVKPKLASSADDVISKIKETVDHCDGSINEVLKTLSKSNSNAETFREDARKNFTDLKAGLVTLGKLENILLQTTDNVLSIKRGMEFNVYTITLEVGDVIKSGAKEINSTFHERFDALNETILSHHNGALANLTSKIETEISQVRRQIDMMCQEVPSSKQAVNNLQEQTYSNGTFATIDSMGGKVSQITDRMIEVDENLNYLLGRLSLVTYEFNQIKIGLGSALDDMRSSFQILQNKIQDVRRGHY